MSNGRTFVLVHGSNFNKGSWKSVERELRKKGANVASIDLPGRGHLSNVPPEEVTLRESAKSLCSQLAEDSENVLVVHSQAGAIVNEALGICPSKIDMVIYVAAVVPLPGEKPFDQLSAEDASHFDDEIKLDKARGVYAVKNLTRLVDHFAPGATEPEREIIRGTIVDEPAAIGDGVVSTPMNVIESKPKHYIYTKADRIVGQDAQQLFTKRLAFDSVHEMKSGHLPMVTDPDELSQHLWSIAGIPKTSTNAK